MTENEGTQASLVLARNVMPRLSYRVAILRQHFNLLKNRSVRFRFLYSHRLKTTGFFRLDFGGIFAHEPMPLNFARSPIGIIGFIGQQHSVRGNIIEQIVGGG